MDDGGATAKEGRWLSYAELAELRGITRKAAIRLTQRHRWRRQPGNDGATRVFVTADITRRQTPRNDAGSTPPSDGDAPHYVAAFETALAAVREAHAGEIVVLREQLARAEQGANVERARAGALRDRLNAMQEQLADVHAARQAAEAADARAEKAEQGREAERARAEDLRAQVDVLMAEMVEARTAITRERHRADERRATIEDLRAEAEARSRELAKAQHDAQAAQQAAAGELRRAEAERQARGRWARLRAAWRGE
jgi:hypothetical protein